MTFDLTVSFEFLCAFAPPKPFAETPDHCWVVLPDLTGAQAPFRPHHPCMLYKPAHRVADKEILGESKTPRPVSTAFTNPGVDRQLVVCEGEAIEIRPDGQAMPSAGLTVSGDLSQLVRIATADVGLETLDGGLIHDPAPAGVAARLRLGSGELSEAALTDREFVLVKDGSPPVHLGLVARRVSLDLPGLTFVDFVFRRWSNGTERVLRLRTNDAASTVTVRNCEEEFIWRIDLPSYTEQADNEINQYFRLAADFDAQNPPPQASLVLKSGMMGPNGVCAPKAFDGWKAASA